MTDYSKNTRDDLIDIIKKQQTKISELEKKQVSYVNKMTHDQMYTGLHELDYYERIKIELCTSTSCGESGFYMNSTPYCEERVMKFCECDECYDESDELQCRNFICWRCNHQNKTICQDCSNGEHKNMDEDNYQY